jgi:hypothetical protein
MEEKYFCRNCNGKRNHKQLFEKKTSGDEDGFFQWVDNYLVIECLGCETVSFLQVKGDTSMIEYDEEGNPDYYFDNLIYPYYIESKSKLVNPYMLPKSLKDIYEETINAFKSNSFILTAGGFRAIIEALCNHLKIRKSGNLEERIDLLHNKGYLTLSESKRLHSIRFLGNNALHEMEKPKKEQLNILLEIINHLLSNLFVNDKMIKGKMETIIDKYDDFLKLIQNKITKEMLDGEFTLNQILGNSKPLIAKKSALELISQFNEEIENGKINFLSLNTETEITKYKILKEPELTFNW